MKSPEDVLCDIEQRYQNGEMANNVIIGTKMRFSISMRVYSTKKKESKNTCYS